MLPFASSDLEYYFNAGKAVNVRANIFVESWGSFNAFYYPAKESLVTPVMYGPLAIDLFVVFYRLSGGNIWMFILAWKLCMLLVFVLVGWLTFKVAGETQVGASKRSFYFYWFIQPLILFEWVGNGHFDGVWLIFVLAALLLANRRIWWLAAICLTVGVWIKFIPILIAPWFVLWWWQETNKNNWRSQLWQAAAGIVGTVAVTLVVWRPYWQGLKVFSPVLLQSKWAAQSLFATVYYTLQPIFSNLIGTGYHLYLTTMVQGGLLLLMLYLLYPLIKKGIALIMKKEKWSMVNYLQAIFISLLVYLLVWQNSLPSVMRSR
jgi:hypothetical protein